MAAISGAARFLGGEPLQNVRLTVTGDRSRVARRPPKQRPDTAYAVSLQQSELRREEPSARHRRRYCRLCHRRVGKTLYRRSGRNLESESRTRPPGDEEIDAR